MSFGIIPLILFIIFLISYLKDPRKIINRFLFNTFICFFLLFCILVSWNSSNTILGYIIVLPILALIVMIPFGIVALMFGLFLNARILMKREGRRFTNCLTLIAALGILFCILFLFISPAS
ncbi:YdcF family protein, partial [Bacillus cereus group sp. Bce025]